MAEVLNDLLTERGLIKWQIVRDARISSDSNEAINIIYGYALTTSLQEERIDRKRKRKAGIRVDQEQLTRSCFLVLPAVSSSPTLSIKRLLLLQQCADANEPMANSTTTRQTFLCLTDGANIRYNATTLFTTLSKYQP
ncbi:hypothetical protein P3T76_003675 [Phytophthora citrophthora]|uniref:Uncharacterized protein n=1 Tax=Phytophthora citrophthora TaxID=4793 RepID=A0AAD9LS28_9STRA|nr:hypothetical protein P3T76_003675 [Phytophthora citrophthora]